MNYFYDELVKRYMYLYENKELILAMCIRRINVDDKLKEDIKSYRELQERLFVRDNLNRELFDKIIDSISSQLGIEVFYLYSDVSSEIVDAFDEFLFTDLAIEDTVIYKYVEALKKNDLYMESVNSMIESLQERRSHNQFLRKVPTFTVWKILGYVREKYKNNRVALDALDKYYNIDRTVITGMDSDCGYILRGEEMYDDDKLSKYPSLVSMSGVSSSYIIFDYKGNVYEREDDYIVYEKEPDKEILNGEANTIFMEMLSNMPNLSFERKMDIFNSVNNGKKLTL